MVTPVQVLPLPILVLGVMAAAAFQGTVGTDIA